MTVRKKASIADLEGNLWTIGAKVRGIGYLLKYQDSAAEPPPGDASYGVGVILIDLSDELENLRDALATFR